MNRKIRLFLTLLFASLLVYGAGRLYYRITDGFSMGNITSNFAYDPRWDTRPLTEQEQAQVAAILDQKFSYLGKGCQSYVFLSADKNYVLKFFKYQRFKVQPWLNFFAFIPAVDNYREGRLAAKKRKLESFFASWKLTFDQLQKEAGLIYVHLNKTEHLRKTLYFTDKMGFEHQIDLDRTEFMIQRRATMLCPYIEQLMSQGKVEEAKQLIRKIVELVTSEYDRGLADNDHALMQNTGVLEGEPIHIDIGQFVVNRELSHSEVYFKELFSKTYKFNKWLKKGYPELSDTLEEKLRSIIGEHFDTMQPYFRPHE